MPWQTVSQGLRPWFGTTVLWLGFSYMGQGEGSPDGPCNTMVADGDAGVRAVASRGPREESLGKPCSVIVFDGESPPPGHGSAVPWLLVNSRVIISHPPWVPQTLFPRGTSRTVVGRINYSVFVVRGRYQPVLHLINQQIRKKLKGILSNMFRCSC